MFTTSYLTNVNFWKSQDSTIQNSTLHDAYDKDLVEDYSGGNADGIGANGFSERITIRNNECYHNSDDGIDLGDSTYTLVEGNFNNFQTDYIEHYGNMSVNTWNSWNSSR